MTRRLSPLAAVLLACSLAGSAFAQRFRFGSGELSPRTLTPGLQAKLSLTTEQKEKLAGIQMRFFQDLRAGGQPGGDRQAALMRVTELTRKADAEALAVLTDAQRQQYQGWKTELEPFAGIGRDHVALLAVTGLTPEQKSRLKELATFARTTRERATEGAVTDFETLREVLQELELETDLGLKKILTAEQYQQFEAEAASLPGFRRRP